MTYFDLETQNKKPIRTSINFNAVDLSLPNTQPGGGRFSVDSKGNVWITPAGIFNLLTNDGTIHGIASPLYLEQHYQGPNQIPNNLWPLDQVLSVSEMLESQVNGTNLPMAKAGALNWEVVSGQNTAQSVTIDTRDLHSTLSIYMQCSAGSATLIVKASCNGGAAFDLTLDSFAAAANKVLQYDITHLAQTVAVNPLSFRFLQIDVGAAGSGNTSTLYIGVK